MSIRSCETTLIDGLANLRVVESAEDPPRLLDAVDELELAMLRLRFRDGKPLPARLLEKLRQTLGGAHAPERCEWRSSELEHTARRVFMTPDSKLRTRVLVNGMIRIKGLKKPARLSRGIVLYPPLSLRAFYYAKSTD